MKMLFYNRVLPEFVHLRNHKETYLQGFSKSYTVHLTYEKTSNTLLPYQAQMYQFIPTYLKSTRWENKNNFIIYLKQNICFQVYLVVLEINTIFGLKLEINVNMPDLKKDYSLRNIIKTKMKEASSMLEYEQGNVHAPVVACLDLLKAA